MFLSADSHRRICSTVGLVASDGGVVDHVHHGQVNVDPQHVVEHEAYEGQHSHHVP